jgi:predicted HTH domain antitoxin
MISTLPLHPGQCVAVGVQGEGADHVVRGTIGAGRHRGQRDGALRRPFPPPIVMGMDLVLPIPDDIAERLGPEGLSRRALEAFAIAEYQADRISRYELRRLLGFETRFELDDFLKERGVYDNYTLEDFRREMEDLKRAGF